MPRNTELSPTPHRHAGAHPRAGLAVMLGAAFVMFAVLAISTLTSAVAQTARAGTSFLTPFPENDTWSTLVIGDGFAEGTLHGLVDAFTGEPKLQIERKRHQLRALGRDDYTEAIGELEEAVKSRKVHAAVVFLGYTDRSGVRLPNGRRLRVGADGWREAYGTRIGALLRMLRTRSIAVYWIGLPIMRSEEWNEDINEMNALFRERVTANGGRFIDIYSEMADESGEFVYRGPDVTGKVVRLREGDGMDFTTAGYRKIAFFIERQLKRDMVTARNERAIPLAGGDEEQYLIRAALRGLEPGAAAPGTGNRRTAPANSPAARAAAAWGPSATAATPGAAKSSLYRAETGRISFKTDGPAGKQQAVTMDIIRPPLTASVVALVTRRDKGDKPSQIGETLTDTLSNGLMVMRTVTPASSGPRGAPTIALSQQPFFLVMTKGARLPPKPGRADDFRWPRADDLPLPPAAAGAKRSPIASPVNLRRTERQTKGNR